MQKPLDYQVLWIQLTICSKTNLLIKPITLKFFGCQKKIEIRELLCHFIHVGCLIPSDSHS